MSRVFVVQETTIYDDEGNLVRTKNLSDARQYGELIYLVPARPVRGSTDYYEHMDELLADFTDDDYLMPIGAPEYIAAAGAYAADANGGHYRLLRWLREERRYIVIDVRLWEPNDG